MNCDFCNRPMVTKFEVDDFRCERCGATWNGVAGRPILPSSDPAKRAAEFDADHNPTPEQVAQEVAAERHARRWAAATNDPNGSY